MGIHACTPSFHAQDPKFTTTTLPCLALPLLSLQRRPKLRFYLEIKIGAVECGVRSSRVDSIVAANVLERKASPATEIQLVVSPSSTSAPYGC